MKTFKTLWLLLALPCLIIVSCQRNEFSKNQFTKADNNQLSPTVSSQQGVTTVSGAVGSLDAVTSGESFCSSKVVPLCAGQYMHSGDVTVKTGDDHKTYITFSLVGGWVFKEIHLYVGDSTGIPETKSGNPQVGLFPYSTTFNAPFNLQEYTFVFDSLPASFTVAAHASVLNMVKGKQVDQQTAWGDGCDGEEINKNKGGNWATMFTYSAGDCSFNQVSSNISSSSDMIDVDADICSNPITSYFKESSLMDPASWYVDHITIGGYDYTEAEGRAIGDNEDMDTPEADSKYAFIRVATLKLSNTDFASSPDLLPAINTIENWLKTKGKLSPTNLPTGNVAVKNAAIAINNFIDLHNCPGRR